MLYSDYLAYDRRTALLASNGKEITQLESECLKLRCKQWRSISM